VAPRRLCAAAARRLAPDLVAGALASAHFASFFDPERPIATDVRYFLYFAWRTAEGDLPHLDFFDPKTQLASACGALLYAAARALGADPLATIRAGELAACTLGGVLLFFTGRRLGGGSSVCGFLALLAYLAFPLTGALPAIGPLPKLWMTVFATAGALLAQDRRWVAAGACAALALLDWQIGVFCAFGLALAALASGAGAAALARLAVGALAAAVPYVAWLARGGGLGEAWHQLVFSSLGRAAASQASVGLEDRLRRIEHAVAHGCPGQEWLFATGLLGLALLPWWLRRARGSDRTLLLIPLGVHHGGIAVFSLFDFQWYGDLFALVQSSVLGLTLLGVGAYRSLQDRLPVQASARRRALALGALAVAVVVARPGPLRPPLAITTPDAPAGVRLSDQREVAAQVADRLRGRRALFLGSSELLFLLRWKNPLPFVYWNSAVYSRVRAGSEESQPAAAARLVRSVDPDAVFWRGDPPPGLLPEGYTPLWFASSSGLYRVQGFLRPERGPGSGS
jgi:hypothetical protein